MISNQNQKRFIVTFLMVFLFTFNLGVFVPTKQVKAQAVAVVADAPATVQWITDTIKFLKENIVSKMLASAFLRATNTFVKNLAYKAAEDLATGATGGKPRWFTQDWGEYLRDAGDAASAEFLDQMAAGVGLDICEPPNGINLKLKVGIALDNSKAPQPRCSLNDINERWEEFGERLKDDPLSMLKLNNQSLKQLGYGTDASSEEIRAKLVQSMISVKESDVGYIDYVDKAQNIERTAAEAKAELKRIYEDGPKATVSAITETIKNPGATAEKHLEDVANTTKESANFTTGEFWVDTANIFMNTLVNKTMSGLIENLMKVDPPHNDNDPDDRGLSGSNNRNQRLTFLQKTFTSIKKISFNVGLKDLDVITEMEMDLGGDISGKMNNSTIDSDFAEALRKAKGGETLTLKEAVAQNLIDGNKWFAYVDVASDNPKQPNLEEGYSADNIKKLVKNRVVSVGWQFAAEIIKTERGSLEGCSSQGCTLKNVMDHFDKSGTYREDKDGDGQDEIYKDEYCGWRPISAEPYFINTIGGNPITGNNCQLTDGKIEGIGGVEVKWVGGSVNLPGTCYMYKDNDGDGVIDIVEASEYANQDDCENASPLLDRYYKWELGGCMVRELDESPLCHLVDPDTVLSAPAQQCGAEGYYSILESKESSTRQEDCADVKHCIQEDDQGNCIGGYDYCVKEENIWRFNGDPCSQQFNSCQTLIDDEGQEQSYLTNTLKDCPQEEVGCRDYILEKEKIDNEWIWNNEASRAYFNYSIEDCNESNDGCSEFIEIKAGVNLIPNGSFEINDGLNDQKPDGWTWSNSANKTLNDYFSLVDNSYLGNYAIQHTDSGTKTLYMDYYNLSDDKRIFYTPNKGLYTLSYYAKGNDSNITPKIAFYFEDGSVSGEIENSDAIFRGSSNWERISGYFSVPNVNKKVKYLDIRFQMTGNVSLDGVQFELNELVDSDINEGEGDPSTYKEYGSKFKNYFKKAPDYLNCQDYSLNSYNCQEEYHPCCDYVKYCPAEDLSCSAYYPTNKDPFVPAVIAEEDKCVAECNNYQTFVALPSYFDNLESVENTGDEASPIDSNFIPRTAKDCSEPSCELFTNVDKLGSGAESKEYYSFVRQCVKPEEADIELYYTWEGSDTSAFQLKTWKLLASEETDSGSTDGGYAPCTNVAIGESSCNDSSIEIENCDPATNLDCRTFYDEDAVPHNRLLSKTIPITEECINIRRELSNQIYKIAPSMSQACEAANVGCTTYKGNASNNVRNIFVEDFESGTTLGWMADIENESNNINLRYASEAIQYNGNSMKVWVADESNAIWLSYNLTEAGEKIIPGKQYLLSFWAKAFGDNTSGNNNQAIRYQMDGNNNNQATSYQIYQTPSIVFDNFFYQKAKAQADPTEDILLSFDNNLSVIDNEWLLYEYNIVDFNINEEGDVILNFKININNSIYEYDGIYIDNIVLKGLTNSFDKIRDSWETPRVCLDNNYLGCQEYQDINNNISYLYQFSDLCPEENIGCTAMIDTQNSSMPWQQTFNAYCEDNTEDDCILGNYYYKNYFDIDTDNISNSTVVIPEDELIYLVKNDQYSCNLANKGCQEMSVINNEGHNDSLYLVNNPDYYIPYDFYGRNESSLCSEDYKNCVSFADTEGSKIFKIHPRNLTCEYREAVPERNILSGFYTEDGENCAHLLYNKDYENFTSSIAEDWKPYDDYNNEYAALCSAEENQCTGFIDPLDNLDMVDYVYNQVALVLNYNHPSQWRQAFWNSDLGIIRNFNSGEGISYHPANENDDYDGLNIALDGDRDLLIYQGPNENKEAFFFNVQSDSIYRLSARVKLKDVDSVMTFLSCRPSAEVSNSGNQTEIDKYFVNESWYNSSDKIPYAFPSINSNYITSNNEEWQYIYGLYEILPGAQYCNLAFYIKGEDEDQLTLADINLEKVEGDYYYLDNDNINYQDCNSANLKEGCVLFYDTTQSGVKWNHEMSYDENRLAPGDYHLPSDANALLKVTRDKQCAEWLTCGAQLKTIDPVTQQQKDACVSLIACDELSDDKSGVCSHPFTSGKNAQPLTLDYYHQMRGKAGWSDLDYSGYSIPGLYPLESLVPLEINVNGNTSTVLSRLVVQQDNNNQPYTYKLGVGVKNSLNSIYSDSAVGGNWASNLTSGLGFTDKSCRLYPEKNSPFPWLDKTDIVTEFDDSVSDDYDYIDIKTKSANFANANICQAGTADGALEEGDCECHYTKANYGSETLYFPYDYTNNEIPPEIEISYSGVEDTTFLSRRSTTKYLGWKGFCLDQEQSLFINNTESLNENLRDYRCLTWYPVDVLSGEIDAYAASAEAEVSSIGDIGDTDKLCLVGEDWTTTEDRVYCGRFNDLFDCNVLFKVPAGAKVNIDYYMNNLEISDKLINGTDSGNTWLSDDDFEFEENPFSFSPEAQIIYRANLNPFDSSDYDSDGNEEALSGEHKFNDYDYFGNITEIEYDLQNDIKGLFSDKNMEIFIYNEDVDLNNYNDNNSSYVDIGVQTYKDNGNECDGDRHYPDSCFNIGGGNKHEVWYKEHTCHGGGCWWHDHRWTRRSCAPRNYNYYIKASATQEIFTGKCDTNCKFVDAADDSLNHGRGCLRTIVDDYDHYYNLIDSFGTGSSFDLVACQTATSTDYGVTEDSKFDQDCLFVQAMEGLSINDNQDHLCEYYNIIISDEDHGIYDDENFLVSNKMAENYYKCFSGGVRTVVGEIDYGIGPQLTATNINKICIQYSDYNSGDPFDCSGCLDYSCGENDSCVSDCCDCLETCQIETTNNESNYSLPSCGSTCAKTCKTYVSLDNVIYDSNNFYLNWLSPTDISADNDNEVCNINGEEICGQVLSGTLDNYGQEVDIRFNQIYENSAWADINSPFSITVSPEEDPLLRNMIYTDSRPGSNSFFNDYYSDLSLGESITTAQNRIGNVIKRIPNDNFREFDIDGNWSSPNWNGIYWNETSTLEPIIRQTSYDENDGFSEGASGISINSTHEENILGLDGDLYAYLMFYAYTATGTTPIQEIVIDWTGVNADKLVLKGPFKNHKHDCVRRCGPDYYYAFVEGAAPECVNDSDCSGDVTCYPWTWGDHENACVEDNPGINQDGYFSYTYVYTCNALSDYWQDNCNQYNLEGGCCVYTPSVKITDSWGNSKTENLGDCGGNTCSVIVVPK